MPTGEHRVRTGEANRAAVLAYLIREADLDDLVTASEEEVGQAVGIHQTVVSAHIRALVEDGVLVTEGWTSGVRSHSRMSYRIAEERVA